MSKKLLIDRFGGDVDMTLTESAEAGGGWEVAGEFGKADIPTANGRIYSRKIWEREIGKIQPMMTEGKTFMMSEHPSDGKTKLPLVSGLMKSLEIMPDGRVVGKAKILDNEHGRQLMSIYKAGGKIGVSSRGMGSTKMEGGMEHVDEDYSYMTHDFVADPAVRTSYPDLKTEEKTGVTVKETVEVKQEAKEALVYTEAQLQSKLEEAKTKIEAEAKPVVENKEVKNDVTSQPIVESMGLEELVEKLKTKVDESAEIKKRDEEIANLKLQLESKDKELAEVLAGAKEITESAKRIGLALCYEKVLSSAGPDRADLLESIGPVSEYKSEEMLDEAVKKAKKKIEHKKKVKLEAKKKIEEMETAHKAELAKLQEAADKAKQDTLTAKKELQESLAAQKKLAAKIYLEDVLRVNPNAQKIRKLCEGIEDKSKIDSVIKELAIDESTQKEYNFIQNRLDRLDTIKKGASSLVENQLAKEQPKEVVTGVDAEIAEAIGEAKN